MNIRRSVITFSVAQYYTQRPFCSIHKMSIRSSIGSSLLNVTHIRQLHPLLSASCDIIEASVIIDHVLKIACKGNGASCHTFYSREYLSGFISKSQFWYGCIPQRIDNKNFVSNVTKTAEMQAKAKKITIVLTNEYCCQANKLYTFILFKTKLAL